MTLDVEYCRELQPATKPTPAAAPAAGAASVRASGESLATSATTSAGTAPAGTAPAGAAAAAAGGPLVVYKLRARLRPATSSAAPSASGASGVSGGDGDAAAAGGPWDVEAAVDIAQYVRLQGGQAHVGVVGSGAVYRRADGHGQGGADGGMGLFSGVVAAPPGSLQPPPGPGAGAPPAPPALFGIDLTALEFTGKASTPIAPAYSCPF